MRAVLYLSALFLSFLTTSFAQSDNTFKIGTRVYTGTVNNDGTYGTRCPGILSITGPSETDGYCCVGGDANPSTCPGWPFCTGTSTADDASTSMSCATTIPLSASNYDELQSSASLSYYAEVSTNAIPSATSDISPTATGAAASTSGTSSGNPSTGSSSSITASAGEARDLLAPVGAIGGLMLALAVML